jgi:hypothetical protein
LKPVVALLDGSATQNSSEVTEEREKLKKCTQRRGDLFEQDKRRTVMLRRILALVAIAALQLFICQGDTGVDLTLPLTVEQWQDLDVDFAVVRVVTHYGEIDITGIQNLRRAMAAGIGDLAGYIYPCIGTSYFAKTGGITCSTPSEQLEALQLALQENAATLEAYDQNTWPPTNAPTFA